MNKHSFKHYFNSLCYKKIIFLLRFWLSYENPPGRTAKVLSAPLREESLVHYPGTGNRMGVTILKTENLLRNLSKQIYQGM